MSRKFNTIIIHALSWLETDLLKVFLFVTTILELTKKQAQLTTTQQMSKSGSNQLMQLAAGRLEKSRSAL